MGDSAGEGEEVIEVDLEGVEAVETVEGEVSSTCLEWLRAEARRTLRVDDEDVNKHRRIRRPRRQRRSTRGPGRTTGWISRTWGTKRWPWRRRKRRRENNNRTLALPS